MSGLPALRVGGLEACPQRLAATSCSSGVEEGGYLRWSIAIGRRLSSSILHPALHHSSALVVAYTVCKARRLMMQCTCVRDLPCSAAWFPSSRFDQIFHSLTTASSLTLWSKRRTRGQSLLRATRSLGHLFYVLHPHFLRAISDGSHRLRVVVLFLDPAARTRRRVEGRVEGW